MHSDRNSLTEGPIAKKILLFALPILLGNIFQQFYHAFDSWVVGRFLGDTALAAVSSSGSLIFMILRAEKPRNQHTGTHGNTVEETHKHVN